ncbi:GTP-binding protein Rho1 [Serendipita sp. 399]|nr:GTP-binding protein Rho1 [Serendipita sp. 399]
MDWVLINAAVFSRLITLELRDVCAMEYTERLRRLYYPDACAIIICFGIDNPASLSHVAEIQVPEIRAVTREMRPIVLVGCKLDVRTDPQELEKMRRRGITEPVSTNQGREMARKIGAAVYLECSAKTGEGVEEVFHQAARLTLLANDAIPK